MATISLAFHSVNAAGQVIAGGHAYCVFPEATMTVRELLMEKIHSEFRKARAMSIEASSLQATFGRSFNVQGPLDEQFACQSIIHLFTMGYVVLLVDGKIVSDLDQVVELNRRTGLMLVVGEFAEKNV